MPDLWALAFIFIPGWLLDTYLEYLPVALLLGLLVSITGFAWFLRRLYQAGPGKKPYILFIASLLVANGVVIALLKQGRAGGAFSLIPLPLLLFLLVSVILLLLALVKQGMKKGDGWIGLATAYSQFLMWLVYLYALAKS